MKQKTLNPIRQRSEAGHMGWHLSANNFNLVIHHSEMPFSLLHEVTVRGSVLLTSAWCLCPCAASLPLLSKSSSTTMQKGRPDVDGWVYETGNNSWKIAKLPLFSYFTCSLIQTIVFLELGWWNNITRFLIFPAENWGKTYGSNHATWDYTKFIINRVNPQHFCDPI